MLKGGIRLIGVKKNIFFAMKCCRERNKCELFVAMLGLYSGWQTASKLKSKKQFFVLFFTCIQALSCLRKGPKSCISGIVKQSPGGYRSTVFFE